MTIRQANTVVRRIIVKEWLFSNARYKVWEGVGFVIRDAMLVMMPSVMR